MVVRFATTCDIERTVARPVSGPSTTVLCGARSDEYTAFPHCRECLADVCPDHEAPGTRVDADLEQPATCVCVVCAEGQQ